MGFRTPFLVVFALALGPPLPVKQAEPQGTAVPFVGCKSDGQVGPVPAPDAPVRVVRVDTNIAGRLAYYKANLGAGVLGPRGWNCFGIIGSSGTILYVTPGPINYESLPSPAVGISGPAIQLSNWDGGTSGRFEVARVAALVFPLERDFVRRLNEERAPATAFPSGPYPSDRLVYRSGRIVEYETPGSSTGLGTMSGLRQNNEPIRGVAILKGTTPDLWLLTIRLPTGMSDLATAIIRQLEEQP